MATTKVNEMRKKMFRQFEEQLKVRKPEDSCFYCHSSEDRIVLSHALFWVMTQNIRGGWQSRSSSCCFVNTRKRCLKPTS